MLPFAVPTTPQGHRTLFLSSIEPRHPCGCWEGEKATTGERVGKCLVTRMLDKVGFQGQRSSQARLPFWGWEPLSPVCSKCHVCPLEVLAPKDTAWEGASRSGYRSP